MNSASNLWEADPWDASDELAESQLAGFRVRSSRAIAWSSIRGGPAELFGRDLKFLIGADVEYYASHDGEDMFLMQLIWHGFPDPPQWRLATRPSDRPRQPWQSWGYFDQLPEAWKMPEEPNAQH